MSTAVYPTLGDTTLSPALDHAPAFFSALPRAIWTLIEQERIERRDTALLGVLLDYKTRDSTTVKPSQETLARRMGCSLDTIQRSLSRLAAAGLIVKQRLRNAAGHLRGLAYDLAAVLALMPTKAAKLRSGAWGSDRAVSGPVPSKTACSTPVLPKPQNCGVEVDSQDVVEADTASSPAEQALVSIGVVPDVARRLTVKFGEEVCRRQVAALPHRKKVKNPAAMVVASILQGWAAPLAASGPPRSAPTLGGLRDSTALGMNTFHAPPPDPLDDLTANDYRRLEAEARVDLRRRLPYLRPLLDRGKCGQVVRTRMRAMLTGPEALP